MSDSLAIVGGRTSTLSSVAVSQIMSSDFDTADASKRKMLTFSNSVQDAAHLAGFYEVRTFRFLFRQSIQYYLKQVGKAITLKELQDGFKTFWKARLAGDEYYYRFMPDELVERIDLTTNYRNPATGQLTDKFKKEFDLQGGLGDLLRVRYDVTARPHLGEDGVERHLFQGGRPEGSVRQDGTMAERKPHGVRGQAGRSVPKICQWHPAPPAWQRRHRP
jgi:hypothetical protein